MFCPSLGFETIFLSRIPDTLCFFSLCFLSSIFSGAHKAVGLDETHVVVLTQSNFEEVTTAAGKITLVEFYAPW